MTLSANEWAAIPLKTCRNCQPRVSGGSRGCMVTVARDRKVMGCRSRRFRAYHTRVIDCGTDIFWSKPRLFPQSLLPTKKLCCRRVFLPAGFHAGGFSCRRVTVPTGYCTDVTIPVHNSNRAPFRRAFYTPAFHPQSLTEKLREKLLQ